MHRTPLAISFGPELGDGFDQTGCTVRDRQPRCAQPPPYQVAAQIEPVLVSLALAQPHSYQHALALGGVPPCDQHTLLFSTGSRGQLGRGGARCRARAQPVSPLRPPNRACASRRTRLSMTTGGKDSICSSTVSKGFECCAVPHGLGTSGLVCSVPPRRLLAPA